MLPRLFKVNIGAVLESMELQIERVETKKALLEFIKFPWRIYRENKYWVPPLIRERLAFLNPKKNPFFRHSQVALFLARRSKDIVGTIASVVDDNYVKFHKEKAGFFGMFEVIDDFTIAHRLILTAKQWLKDKGMEVIRGPMNLSMNQECGLLIDNFDSRPVVMMTYNPDYYVKLIESLGFRKAKDLYAYAVDLSTFGKHAEKLPHKLNNVAYIAINKEEIDVRKINLKDFDNEVERVKMVYNSAWSKNWGFVPMNDEEFHQLAKGLKPFLDPDLLYIAEVKGKPVGVCITIPDINQALARINGRLFPFGALKLLWYRRKIDTLRVLVMGVIENYRLRGIDALFYFHTAKQAIKKRYTRCEMSWILEDNIKTIGAAEMMGGKPYKTYRIYEMPL